MTTTTTTTTTGARRDRIEQSIGTADQWRRVRNDRNTRRADAAYRNAEQCGTDPSWYGY